jgi:hypothetical protein
MQSFDKNQCATRAVQCQPQRRIGLLEIIEGEMGQIYYKTKEACRVKYANICRSIVFLHRNDVAPAKMWPWGSLPANIKCKTQMEVQN